MSQSVRISLHALPIVTMSCLCLAGTLVLGVQAQGSLAETIVYGIDLLPSDEGVFVIDSATGDITVGPNGTSRLTIQVILRDDIGK